MTTLTLLTPLEHAILVGAEARLSQSEIAAQQRTTPSMIARFVVRLRALGHDVRLPMATAHPVTRGMHDAVIVALEAVGVSCHEMGRRLGCTDATVAKRLRLIRIAQGLPARKTDARTVRYSLAAAPMDLLTPRQREAWDAVAAHKDQKQAALAVGMNCATLRTHLHFARRRIAEASA